MSQEMNGKATSPGKIHMLSGIMTVKHIKKTLVFMLAAGLMTASLLFATGCGGQGEDASKEEKAIPEKPAV